MIDKNKRKSLTEQAQEILEAAERSGVQSNLFFVTTFKRYQVQLKLLQDLEKRMNDEGLTVTKEYLRGSPTQQPHPAFNMYIKTCFQADSTVKTLLKLIESFKIANGNDEKDPLLEALNAR